MLVNPSYFHPEGETPVYAAPSVDSKRIGLISEGASYPIIGEYNGFLVISLRGASGFVSPPKRRFFRPKKEEEPPMKNAI